MENRVNVSLLNQSVILLVGAGASANLKLETTSQIMSDINIKVRDAGNKIGGSISLFPEVNELKNMLEKAYGVYDLESLIEYEEYWIERVNYLRELIIKEQKKDEDKFNKDWNQIIQNLRFGEGRRRPIDKYGSEFNPNYFQRVAKCLRTIVKDHYSKINGKPALESGQEAYKHHSVLIEEIAKINRITNRFVGTIIPIFSLNYDLVFEMAVQGSGWWNLVDGFPKPGGEYNGQIFEQLDSYDGRLNLALFKLHGSVSWEWIRGRFNTITKNNYPDPERIDEERIVAIWPGITNKTDIGQFPFFRIGYDNFRESLSHAKVLLIIGCTLRDAHIAEPIGKYLKEREGALNIVVVDPSLNVNSKLSMTIDVIAYRLKIDREIADKYIHSVPDRYPDGKCVDAIIENVKKYVQ